jgi:hypothetical protein
MRPHICPTVLLHMSHMLTHRITHAHTCGHTHIHPFPCLQVDACLMKLRAALALEVKLCETLSQLSGCLEPLLAAALAGAAVTAEA